MKKPIYFDYAATTPVDPRVAEKMAACLTLDGNFGNPSSAHVYGRTAAAAVEQARQQVADLINADPVEIIWTSGATEADNLAIKGVAQFYRAKGQHIVTGATEHEAVMDCCRQLEREGFKVTYLGVKPNGLIDLAQLEAALQADTILVSIMQVNNETGVIQDIAAIGKLLKQRGILFHVDAAQSAGKIPIDLTSLPVDLMSFSAHKVYGPKGIGALYIRQKSHVNLLAQMHGGGQERGLRSGTLATHQIVGMGTAFQLAQQELPQESKRILNLRNRLWTGIKTAGDVYHNGDLTHSAPGILNIAFGGIDATTFLPAIKDLAISTGSACHSNALETSPVLRAMGISANLAQSSIRFSLGRFTTEEEVDFAIQKVVYALNTIRKM